MNNQAPTNAPYQKQGQPYNPKSSSDHHHKYYQANKAPYDPKYQGKYYQNPSNPPSNYQAKPPFFNQDPAGYYKNNNYYHNLGKGGYFRGIEQNQNPQWGNLQVPFKKNYNTMTQLDLSDHSNEGKSAGVNSKRKNVGGIEEFEGGYPKKLKPDNYGFDERKYSRNSSDFAWVENDTPPSMVEESSYSKEDLPEISKKIDKLVEEIKNEVNSEDMENNFMTSFSLANLNPKLDYIGDNPVITEKTIKVFKERLQTKGDAFDPYLPKTTENSMSIEMPLRILTVPRSLITVKEYEEMIENVEEDLKSQVKILNEENKNIIKFKYLYEKTKSQYRSLLDNINL